MQVQILQSARPPVLSGEITLFIETHWAFWPTKWDPRIARLVQRLQSMRDCWYQRGYDDCIQWAVELATRKELQSVATHLAAQDGQQLAALFRKRHFHQQDIPLPVPPHPQAPPLPPPMVHAVPLPPASPIMFYHPLMKGKEFRDEVYCCYPCRIFAIPIRG
jgi:hypothetical protein